MTISDDQALLLSVARTSPALSWMSAKAGSFEYPKKFNGKVPLKVRTKRAVRPDSPGLVAHLNNEVKTDCSKDHEYYAWVNSYGAVSAILSKDYKLGLLPSEFQVTEWHPHNE